MAEEQQGHKSAIVTGAVAGTLAGALVGGASTLTYAAQHFSPQGLEARADQLLSWRLEALTTLQKIFEQAVPRPQAQEAWQEGSTGLKQAVRSWAQKSAEFVDSHPVMHELNKQEKLFEGMEKAAEHYHQASWLKKPLIAFANMPVSGKVGIGVSVLTASILTGYMLGTTKQEETTKAR